LNNENDDVNNTDEIPIKDIINIKSYHVKINITCEECGKKDTIIVKSEDVNGLRDKRMRQFTCEECGKTHDIETDILVNLDGRIITTYGEYEKIYFPNNADKDTISPKFIDKIGHQQKNCVHRKNLQEFLENTDSDVKKHLRDDLKKMLEDKKIQLKKK